ncbi:MAG: hypothetical protein ACYS74_09160, partial [Planctomycetota bacterium]
PLLTARIESARWSEGKAGAGMVATAVRAYAAEMQEPEGGGLSADVFEYIPITDLEGRYFNSACYSFTDAPAIDTAGVLTYEIQVDSGAGYHPELFTRVTLLTLDETGIFVGTAP